MLIPNLVPADGTLTLAVPGPSYWCGTSAEYYINPPGYTTEQACVWGDNTQPIGNWAPFVAGANQVASGETFVTAGINPIYCCDASSSYHTTDPGFAIRIDCPSGNCNGMPCECNPATMGVNKCSGGSVGAGGAEFCVVTVPAGETANLVIFSTTGNNSVISSTPIQASSSAVPAPAPPTTSKTSSSSSSSSSTSSSTYVAPPSSSIATPSSSASSEWSQSNNASGTTSQQNSYDGDDETIQIYPSNVPLLQNQGYPNGSVSYNSTTTTKSTSVSVAAASSSPSHSSSSSLTLPQLTFPFLFVGVIAGLVL